MDPVLVMSRLVPAAGSAVFDFFETLFPAPLRELETLEPKEAAAFASAGDAIGVVRFQGACEGQFSVHIPREFSARIAKTLYALPDAPDPDDVLAAAGEVATLVAGRVAATVGRRGVACLCAAPTAVGGDEYAAVAPVPGSLLRVLKFSADQFELLVMIATSEAGAATPVKEEA